MKGERFTIDTNILVYFVHVAAGDWHQGAISIIEAASVRDCWLTLQALSEFYVVTTGKRILPRDVAASQIQDWLELYPTIGYSAENVQEALTIAVKTRASYWDALMCATAAGAGCRAILTEDMADGSFVGGIRVVRPFKEGSLTAAASELLGI